MKETNDVLNINEINEQNTNSINELKTIYNIFKRKNMKLLFKDAYLHIGEITTTNKALTIADIKKEPKFKDISIILDWKDSKYRKEIRNILKENLEIIKNINEQISKKKHNYGNTDDLSNIITRNTHKIENSENKLLYLTRYKYNIILSIIIVVFMIGSFLYINKRNIL